MNDSVTLGEKIAGWIPETPNMSFPVPLEVAEQMQRRINELEAAVNYVLDARGTLHNDPHYCWRIALATLARMKYDPEDGTWKRS